MGLVKEKLGGEGLNYEESLEAMRAANRAVSSTLDELDRLADEIAERLYPTKKQDVHVRKIEMRDGVYVWHLVKAL